MSGRLCKRLEAMGIRGELTCSETGYACDVAQEDMMDHRRINRGTRGDTLWPKAEAELPAVDADTGEAILEQNDCLAR